MHITNELSRGSVILRYREPASGLSGKRSQSLDQSTGALASRKARIQNLAAVFALTPGGVLLKLAKVS